MGRLHQSIGLDAPARSEPAQHIKTVARRLFAERGVDGVTVREIAAASGQRNHAAVGYHFGSKEALVREIILDGAIVIDEQRNMLLDQAEAEGGPTTIREVVDLLIDPVIINEDRAGEPSNYIRFITLLSMTHRQLFMDALADRWNSAYLRCLDHLRKLMPPMPQEAQNQRFIFLGAYLGSVLARREAALADQSRTHPTWTSDAILDHFAQTATALLDAPYQTKRPSEEDAKARSVIVPGPVG